MIKHHSFSNNKKKNKAILKSLFALDSHFPVKCSWKMFADAAEMPLLQVWINLTWFYLYWKDSLYLQPATVHIRVVLSFSQDKTKEVGTFPSWES